MEPNLTIYDIAIRYTIMAILVGVGAGITSMDGFLNTLGYIMMALGVIFFLMSVLGVDPTKGDNTEAKKESKEDFIEQ